MVESAARDLLRAEPTGHELARVAGLAALLAAVPAGIDTLRQAGGLRDYVLILVLIALVTLGVFAWGVPSALTLYEPGPSVVGVALSGLALVSLLLFWTGLPAVLAGGGIVLGRTQLDDPEDKPLALAAIRLGLAAIAVYLLVVLVDLV